MSLDIIPRIVEKVLVRDALGNLHAISENATVQETSSTPRSAVEANTVRSPRVVYPTVIRPLTTPTPEQWSRYCERRFYKALLGAGKYAQAKSSEWSAGENCDVQVSHTGNVWRLIVTAYFVPPKPLSENFADGKAI
jgi:hypothetical protein